MKKARTARAKKANSARKPYERPVLEQVALVAEESVLGACKGNGAGPSNPHRNCKIGPDDCLVRGS
jgi:hypothetical protein